MIVKVSELCVNSRKHTIKELRLLFRSNVDERISGYVLGMMSEREMRRLIAMAIYDRAVTHKNRQMAMGRIAGYLCISVSSIEKWCPAKKKRPLD